MAIIARASGDGQQRELPEAGTHMAVCVQVIDIGTQETEWQGKTVAQRKILIGWELDTTDSEGEPFVQWQRYTLSLNERASLRRDLENWRGRQFSADELEAFDLKNIMGKSCLLQIVHSPGKEGRTYANVSGVSALMKSQKPIKPTKPLVYFDLTDPDPDLFETFGDGLKKTILKSPEGAAWAAGGTKKSQDAASDAPDDAGDDDIPF